MVFHAELLSVYKKAAPSGIVRTVGNSGCFPATFDINTPMQFSLQLMAMALALVTAAAAAPVDLGARPTFMPGPIVPDESYTGYNPFKAVVTTTGSDN